MIAEALRHLLVDRIRTLCVSCTIYLFGSYAYGNPTAQSDLDIAVVMDHVESKIQQATNLWNVLKDTGIPKDIVLYG